MGSKWELDPPRELTEQAGTNPDALEFTMEYFLEGTYFGKITIIIIF